MMKKLLTSLFALAVMATASAQMTDGAKARVYAYGLTQSGDDVVTVAFKTNTKANTAVVTLSAEGQEDIEVPAESTDGVNWTAEITPSQKFAAGVDYNWSVEVSADAVTEWTRISDNDKSAFHFYRPYGIAVDKAPESANFGRVYVTNNIDYENTNASRDRATVAGIYTFTPTLDAENNANAYTCGVVGDGSTSGGSPRDIVVGPDGMLYMADYTTATSGLYIVDPNNNFSHAAIFEGTRDDNGYIKDASENIVSGKPFGVGVLGTGDDREIYAIGYQGESNGVSRIYRYDIGENSTWSTVPTFSEYTFSYNNKTPQVYYSNCAVEPISTGGYWITQNQATSSVGVPSLMYFNNNNELVLTLEGLGAEGTSSKNGALAVDERTKTVVIGNGANARFVKYDVDENDNVTVDITKITTNALGIQGYSNAFDFDYAGNLYSVTSGSENLAVFAVPDAIMGENTCTTPAKKSLTIAYTQGQIEATGVETIGVDNAPVEYYNLQGVKVENPENGIFIKKQGNKAVKVIL